jgi:uncharacterized membrane protein
MSQPARSRLLRTFVTGLIAALPLAMTLAVLTFLVQLVNEWLGPGSLIGGLLVWLGFGIGDSELMRYGLGLALVGGLIFGLGLLVEAGLERGLARAVNALIRRIPLVRNLYDLIRRFVDLLAQDKSEGLKSMSPVWCHFGGPDAADGGVAVLALLSTPEPLLLGGKPYLAVLVPTAPVPIGGGLLYVPQSWVVPAELGMDALTSLYVSMGVTSAQHLPRA